MLPKLPWTPSKDGYLLKDADGHTVSPITQFYEMNHPNIKDIHKYMAKCTQPGVQQIIESNRIQELCNYLDSNPLTNAGCATESPKTDS